MKENKRKMLIGLVITLLVITIGFIYLKSDITLSLGDDTRTIYVGVTESTDIVRNEIEDMLINYTYTIKDRFGDTYTLSLVDMVDRDYTTLSKDIKRGSTLDVTKYIKVKNDLTTVLKPNTALPKGKNATIVYDTEINEYTMTQSVVKGVLVENADELLANSVSTYNKEIDLVAIDLYEQPDVTEENEQLKDTFRLLTEYNDFKMTYIFGDVEETIDMSVLKDWLYVQDKAIRVDGQKIDNYINELVLKYTTLVNERKFSTSDGEEVVLINGDYGWVLDGKAMRNDILSSIVLKQGGVKEAIYTQKAETNKTYNNFTNTYIEISKDGKHLWYYKDGEVFVEDEIVIQDENLIEGCYKIKKIEDGVLYFSNNSLYANKNVANNNIQGIELESSTMEEILGVVEETTPIIIW